MNKMIKELKKGETYYLLKFDGKEAKDSTNVLKCTVESDPFQNFDRWTVRLEIEVDGKKSIAGFHNFDKRYPGLDCNEPLIWPQMMISEDKRFHNVKFTISETPENCVKDYNDFLGMFLK